MLYKRLWTRLTYHFLGVSIPVTFNSFKSSFVDCCFDNLIIFLLVSVAAVYRFLISVRLGCPHIYWTGVIAPPRLAELCDHLLFVWSVIL